MNDNGLNRTEIARALASLRRTVTTPCTVCGTPMTGKVHRKTCSDACRVRAYRLRQQARNQQPLQDEMTQSSPHTEQQDEESQS